MLQNNLAFGSARFAQYKITQPNLRLAFEKARGHSPYIL
jgi:hypothetical protein